MSTTTIRIGDALKAGLAAAAERAGTSIHALIPEARTQTVEQAEQAAELHLLADTGWARLAVAPAVLDDLDRIAAHVSAHQGGNAARPANVIIDALDNLAQNPDIGRPVRGGKRALIIGRGREGYVAVYLHLPDLAIMFILAVSAPSEVT